MTDPNDAGDDGASHAAFERLQEKKLKELESLISDLTDKNAAQAIALRVLSLHITGQSRQARLNLATQARDASQGTDLGVEVAKLLGVSDL